MTELGSELVLVTGALGWAGSRLVECLVRGLTDDPLFQTPQPGLRIRCLVLPGQDADPLRRLSDKVEVVHGDLREPVDCTRLFDGAREGLVFHTAGVIHPRRVSDFYSINVEGAKRLVDAAARAGVRRIVALSSNSPCGFNPHPDHLFDELSVDRPYMNYGRSKLEMEEVFRAAHAAGRLETVILRPPWFYGPNQPPRQSLFFRMIREGKAPIVGGGDNLRSMLYIDNLCQGLLRAASVKHAAGRTYWIADQRPYSMNEIVDTVERLLETEFGLACAHRRLRLPRLASSAARVADRVLQAAGLYHQKIHVLSEMAMTIACSIGKAEEELGYRPTVGLDEGMRRSLKWCQGAGIQF